MTRHLYSASLLLALLPGLSALGGEVQLKGYTFRVPDGFTAEVVADEPLVTYPICADFDEQGRLYVAEASGSKDWNKPQPEETRHRVLRLEDSDGDGRFDKRTVFATFEMLAQGSMWLDGSLYVAAAPIIWKLTDEDGDGVAERREKWVETEEVTGCLNDLRGPYLGPDGWIYWCKGAGSKQTYQVDGKPWSTTARHIFRRHPDGGDVEQVMVGGMDNPVEVAFSRGGERFFTSTNIHFLGQPRKDGILHAVYGGIFPKDISPVYEFPWSGPRLMQEMTGWGALSPCGLTRYKSGGFGDEYRDNLFSALFSGHKIMRHVIVPDGATFKAHNEDFLACDDAQFHPTDVLEDADGSLLVIETGGWYLHCCPSSTFYRPDHHGAIYRIRRKGSHQAADPRGQKLDWGKPTAPELAKRLEDKRPAVRRRAVNQLGHLGAAAVPVLQNVVGNSKSTEARCQAVWSATRIDHPSARGLVRLALKDPDETVRHAALSSISLWRDHQAVPPLLAVLGEPSVQNRRVAAEALGRIGDESAVPGLLAAAAEPADPFLEHSITFALIEIADPKGTQAGLDSESVHTRRAAMTALDQMVAASLDPKQVIAELDSPDAKMQEVAWWLVSRHSREWGGMLADKLRARVRDKDLGDSDRQILVARLAQVARAPELSSWIAAELTKAGVSSETRIVLLQAMADASEQSIAADAGRRSADKRWVEAMLALLEEGTNAAVVAEAVAALKRQPAVSGKTDGGKPLRQVFNADLRRTGQRSGIGDATRLAALSAIQGSSIGKVDDKLFAFLLTKIGPDEPLDLRSTAADVLSRSQLSEAQLLKLAGSMKNLASTELKPVLGLFKNCKDNAAGLRLVGSLQASSAAATLNAFFLKNCLAGFGQDVQQQARPLFERLEKAQGIQLARARRAIELLPAADPQRGMQVFRSNKAACILCHQTAHLGGNLGPHLRGIGQRRSERDIVESIIFPSASFVQSYETWIVDTADGGSFSGVIRKDTPTELVLEAAPGAKVSIPRNTITTMARGEVSAMPQGLDQALTDQELADLTAYLVSLK